MIVDTWSDHFEGFDNFGSAPFDPWPIVYMFERLRANPNEAVYRQMWRELYSEQQAAQARWLGSIARSPDSQVLAAGQCLTLRAAIEGGAGGPLLEAVALCAASGVTLPAWIALPYVERFWGAHAGVHKTWEDAFGPIRGTVKAREAKAMGLDTYRAALGVLAENPDKALNSAFYSEVGELVERGHSAVQEIIRDYISAQDAAPLVYVKQHLQAGGTLRSAASAWFHEKAARWIERGESR
ncbi:hypothetical protein [uncultured Piscinibacter sp.]|uniref:hypothetical protein n=1 Tax=uncultured Piscinibacter sp. TaxID=1131835 RepID=UPI0026047B34|nr:hypothetical protein [uncultured Piscinibacter sp.]